MIPAPAAGHFIGLPDNGYGAQNNSADFVLGFYDVTPHFKITGDGTTSRGPVDVDGHTPFSDPQQLLDATFITGGPVYDRSTYYPSSPIPVDASIRNLRLLTGADFDVESIARMDDGTFRVGEEFGPYLNEVDPSTGILAKRLIVDLLDIDDPDDIGGPLVGIAADRFNFPLQSVESLTPIDDFTVLVGLDNNYPGGNGRVPGTPDGTEIITLTSKVPLRTLRVQSCKDASTGARNGQDPKGSNCR